MAQAKTKRGGKREGAGREEGSANKDPRSVMKEFGLPDNYMSPLEFCLAVINLDKAKLKHTDKGRGQKITIGQRLLAARVVAPYFHQKLPELVEQSITHSWADMVREAEERERTMKAEYASNTPARPLH